MPNVVVNIFPSIIEDLQKSSLNQSPNETGGVLIGTRSFNETTLEYNVLGCLCVADYEEFKGIYKATPTSFTCTDKDGWARIALKAVERFGMSYIGDWHTHPRSSLSILSSLDLETLWQQYNLEQFKPYPPLHLLIQWADNQNISIRANVLLGKILIITEPNLIKK